MPAADHLGRLVSEVGAEAFGRKIEPIYRSIASGKGPTADHEIRRRNACSAGTNSHLAGGAYYPVKIHEEIIGVGVIVNEIHRSERLPKRQGRNSNPNSFSRRKWKLSAGWREASPTTSTTS